MEAERETTKNVELFWQLFNEVIYRASNRECTSFNPIVWCTDMADSNLARICKVSGEHAKNTKHAKKSCEFHFKDQRNKKAKRLYTDSAAQFKSLCDTLMKSTTVSAYNSARHHLDCFTAEDTDLGFLKTWTSWWHERRGFIFRAFTPTNTPEMNQTEVVHTGWANRAKPNMSLLDACQADVRNNLLLQKELKSLHSSSFINHSRE